VDEFIYSYILESENHGKKYVRYTKHLNLRFEQHQNGEIKSIKDRRPLKLFYFEACHCQADALKREKYFKTHYGKMLLKNRLKSYFTG